MILFGDLFLMRCDGLSKIMVALIIFVSLNVLMFTNTYLVGDRRRKSVLFHLSLLTCTLVAVTLVDNIFTFVGFWLTSNLILARLIMHNKAWAAAKASGRIAQKNFILGALFFLCASILLFNQTGTTSIQEIIHTPLQNKITLISALLITLTAFTQSGLIPFDGWLKSSLNSPTVVSAFMHAGIINGGGFLLVRFAPLITQEKSILYFLVIGGTITAIAGTFWKLIQSDVKRMLVFSTVAQMGFMVVECGLGLFPVAVAHLVWHGLFKAHLFLISSTISKQKRVLLPSPDIRQFFIATTLGLIGTTFYWEIVSEEALSANSHLFMCVCVFVFLSQTALTSLAFFSFRAVVKALGLVILFATSYGYTVDFIEHFVSFSSPQPLNIFHYFILTVFIALWLGKTFSHLLPKINRNLWPRIYMFFLNSGQPKPETITSQHQDYHC